MRVLVLANDSVGLYKFRRELLQELIDQGNEIFISLPDGLFVESLKKCGCKFILTPIDRRGISPKTDLKIMLCYYKMMKRMKPDLVISYTIKPNVYGGIVCRFLKRTYIMNITGLGSAFQKDTFLKKFVIRLYKAATKKVKMILFENTDNLQTFLDNRIMKRNKAYVMPGAGVNLNDYLFSEYPKEKPVRFLFMGRIMKEKGVDELFEAAKRIKKEFPDTAFDFVGYMENDYRNTIESLVAQDVIYYHGFQEDVKSFINRCHCFILPSWHEGMSNANLECAAMGRPLITSNICGCKEAVIENKSGFLCEPKDVDSLYLAIKKFLLLSEQKRKEMGIASSNHMEKMFDRRKVVEKTMEIIEQN